MARVASMTTIPIYQRTYSWTEAQCRQLWEDILRAGADDEILAHFIGSIVYIEKGLYQVSSQSPLLVIDGQQRLTTVSLIIEAIARHVGDSEPVDGFSAKKLRHYYLLNPLEDGKQRYKLLLTQTDEQTLLAMVDQRPLPTQFSLRLRDNLGFFAERVKELGEDLVPLCTGLEKLMVVDISLSRELLRRVTTSAGNHNINSNSIRLIRLPVPVSQDAQKQIVELAKGFRLLVDNLIGKTEALEDLKRSLMHDLFTGKVRVRDAWKVAAS